MMKKRNPDPELKQLLSELEEVAEKLGFRVRYEKGNFEGGYCILRDSKLLVINTRNETEKRINTLSKSLKEIGIGDIFVKPALRDLIEGNKDLNGKGSVKKESQSQ